MLDRCEPADNVSDAAALAVAFADGDSEAIECILSNGCARGIAYVACGWVGVLLAWLDEEKAARMVAGWRQRAEELRQSATAGD